jgi:hypothetical protein
VVATSFRALRRDRVVAVPGVINGAAAWIARRLPLRLAAVVAERTLRRTGSRGSGPATAPGGKGGGDA